MSKSRLFLSLGTYAVLGFVPVATNIVVVPLYLRYLSVAEYGQVGLANVALAFMQLLSGLGMVEAYDRLYFEKEGPAADKRALLGTTISSLVASFSLLGLLLLAFGGPIFKVAIGSLPFEPFGWWILVSAFGSTLQSMVFLSYRNSENLRLSVTASLLPFFGGVSGTLLSVAVLEGGALGAVQGRALGFLLGTLPAFAWLVRGGRLRFEAPVLRAMLAYGLPVVVYVFFNSMLFLGDRLLFERWAGVEAVAVYVLGLTILSPADVLANAVGTAVQPRIYRKLRDDDPSAWRDLQRIYEALFAFEVVLLCIALTCATPVVKLIGKSAYAQSDQFLPVLAFAHLFRLRYLYFSFPLFFFKRTRFLPIMTAVSIVVGFLGAWAGHRVAGTIGIAAGVVAWKFSQQAIAHGYLRLTGISKTAGMPASTVITALFGAWMGAELLLPAHALTIRWVGALAMSALAGTVLMAQWRGRALALLPGK